MQMQACVFRRCNAVRLWPLVQTLAGRKLLQALLTALQRAWRCSGCPACLRQHHGCAGRGGHWAAVPGSACKQRVFPAVSMGSGLAGLDARFPNLLWSHLGRRITMQLAEGQCVHDPGLLGEHKVCPPRSAAAYLHHRESLGMFPACGKSGRAAMYTAGNRAGLWLSGANSQCHRKGGDGAGGNLLRTPEQLTALAQANGQRLSRACGDRAICKSRDTQNGYV